MSQNLNNAIHKAMLEMLKKFNNNLNKSQMESEEKLSTWAHYLAFERRFTVTQVAHALSSLMRENVKFMPSAYEIADALKPKEVSSEDIGNFVANEVIEKVKSFGAYRLSEAMDALSDVSKQVVGQNSYILADIATSLQEQLPTIRAQIRGMAKAAAEAHKANQVNDRLQKIGINTGNVISIGRKANGLMALNFQEFNPEDAS